MARGDTLEEIVAFVRHEAGLGSNAASITDSLDQIKHHIRRCQDDLYEEFDWPFLRVRNVTKAMVAGERYYDFPATVNPLRAFSVRRSWNNDDLPIEQGIGWEQYNSLNSDDDQRNDPVQRWDWYTDGTNTQFEVWPIPASAQCTLVFDGMRPLRALTADGDVADLDGYLIALRVARRYAEGDTLKKIIAETERREARLRGNVKGPSRVRTLVGGMAREQRPKGTIIRING